MHPIFGDGGMPRYLQVAELLRQRIASGEWLSGTRLPSLENLGSEFQISRITARQAVILLQKEGLLSAQQGRGTFVTDNASTGRTLRLETSLQALAEYYKKDEPVLTLLDERVDALPAGIRKAAAAYRLLKRIHSRGAEPYCLISLYLDERVFDLAPDRFRKKTVIPILLELPKIQIARAHQTLTVSSANIEVAQHLGIGVGAPIAQVRRTFHGIDDVVLYHGIAAYHSDFHLEMELKT